MKENACWTALALKQSALLVDKVERLSQFKVHGVGMRAMLKYTDMEDFPEECQFTNLTIFGV